ncbi:MAG: biotin-dependent carboxyltransferase family protein [Sulfurospirillum sp.]|nr:biotin-dependent carboxyltransferase family protein [Sulfurospirillum sp.]
MSGGFEVIQAGIQASIQDLGRIGLTQIGVSRAGALDEFAFHHANKLLGNKYGSNMLEILLGGVKLKAKRATTFILTGAKVDATINNKPIEIWKTYKIDDGDILNLGFATCGVRVYLAVKDGFNIEQKYGSCSVNIKEKLGGKQLQAKEFLPFTCNCLSDNRKLPNKYLQNYDKLLIMRVVAGYQWDMFNHEEREKFFNTLYRVTGQNDRMGYRLSGDKIVSTCKGIISEPIAYGSVQIPTHGEPIVLLKERQTIGGYPKIGAVIPVDCFRLAQAKQDTHVKFKLVSLDMARDINIEFYKFFKEF